jgi:hypothetical protein
MYSFGESNVAGGQAGSLRSGKSHISIAGLKRSPSSHLEGSPTTAPSTQSYTLFRKCKNVNFHSFHILSYIPLLAISGNFNSMNSGGWAFGGWTGWW